MLLFDDTKALEKALGTEAAAVIAHVYEKADDRLRQEIASKADLDVLRADFETMRVSVKADMEASHNATNANIAMLRKDMEGLRGETRAEMSALRKDFEALRKDMEGMRHEMRIELKMGLDKHKQEMLRWYLGGFIAQCALIVALFSFLK
jgi:hypothetical protein